MSAMAFIFVLLTMTALSATTAAAQTTVVVTGNTSTAENVPGWYFSRDTANATPYTFTNRFNSIGNGSLFTGVISTAAAKKFIGEHFINVAISTVNSISGDFKIAGNGTAASANQFYLNVYANFGESDDLKFYDCRYDVIATTGSTSGFSTLTFDPTLPYSVTTRGGASASPYPCPSIPADMNSLSAGSNIRAYSLNTGDTSLNDAGLAGYWDNVVTDLDSGVTIYDFEMSASKCKNGGWSTMTGSDGNPYINQGDCVSDTVRDRSFSVLFIQTIRLANNNRQANLNNKINRELIY